MWRILLDTDHVNIVKAEPISNHGDMTGCNQSSTSCKHSLTHTTDNLKTAYHFLFFAVVVKRRHVVVFHSRQVWKKENGGQQLFKNLCNKTLTSSLGLKREKKIKKSYMETRRSYLYTSLCACRVAMTGKGGKKTTPIRAEYVNDVLNFSLMRDGNVTAFSWTPAKTGGGCSRNVTGPDSVRLPSWLYRRETYLMRPHSCQNGASVSNLLWIMFSARILVPPSILPSCSSLAFHPSSVPLSFLLPSLTSDTSSFLPQRSWWSWRSSSGGPEHKCIQWAVWKGRRLTQRLQSPELIYAAAVSEAPSLWHCAAAINTDSCPRYTHH